MGKAVMAGTNSGYLNFIIEFMNRELWTNVAIIGPKLEHEPFLDICDAFGVKTELFDSNPWNVIPRPYNCVDVIWDGPFDFSCFHGIIHFKPEEMFPMPRLYKQKYVLVFPSDNRIHRRLPTTPWSELGLEKRETEKFKNHTLVIGETNDLPKMPSRGNDTVRPI